MAILPIRTFGDPVLRRRAAEVGSADEALRKLMRDLRDTVIAAPGVGLAAPQIGVPRRVFVWSYEGSEGALANPKIVEQHGRVEADEACLSVPGLSYPVERAEWVRVIGMDDRGRQVDLVMEEWKARIFQHEIDHLDGVLFIDRVDPVTRDRIKRKIKKEGLREDASRHAFAL